MKHKQKKNASYQTSEMKELFDAIDTLKNSEDIANFFRDLLTISELKEFANRWQIVKLLYQKKPYTEIADTLGVSTATVTRVAHWLNHGKGGYKKVADKLFI